MKKHVEEKQESLSGRTTEPVPPAAKPEQPQPAETRAGTEAPVPSTPDFKAGKDL